MRWPTPPLRGGAACGPSLARRGAVAGGSRPSRRLALRLALALVSAATAAPASAAAAAAAGDKLAAGPDLEPPARQLAARAAHHPAGGAGAQGAAAEGKEEDDAADDWLILDRAHHVRHQALRLSAGAWSDRVSAGLWYGLPVAHEGILPHINDAIVLDVGGDYTWLHGEGESTHGLWVAVGPRWDFHLTQAWTLYAALPMGFFVTLSTTPRDGPNFFQPGIGMGGLYRVAAPLQLALDFGYPQGLRFGLAIDLDG